MKLETNLTIKGLKTMTSKEQLIQELETFSEQFIDEILDYINLRKNQHLSKLDESTKSRGGFDEEWWDNLSQFTPDFLDDRSQPELQHREELFL